MLLTIVIPTYKRNTKLRRLLLSIGENVPVEVIVVDDSEGFESKALQAEFVHVNFCRNTKGKGAGGARNTGLQLAQGEFIIFADSDDVFLNGWYKTVSSYFDRSYDVVYFSPTSFVEKSISCAGKRHLRYDKLIKLSLLSNSNDILYYFYVPWSKLLRTQFLKEQSIVFEEIIVSNDINFSLDVGTKQHCYFVTSESFYSVEEGTNSLTKEWNTDKLTCRLDALFRFNAKLDSLRLSKKKLMMAPWLWKLLKSDLKIGLIYLLKGVYRRTPLLFDHRFRR